jgi:hypothetical protein
MPSYWVTFVGRTRPGCIVAEGEERVRDIAETRFGEAVSTIDGLPYRAFPVLYYEGETSDGFEPRCSDPNRCKGHVFCQKRPSCSE